MREFRHYILTPFNLHLYGERREAQLANARLTPDEWMDHRLELFGTYTLPSIAGQSCKDFTWLVMLDENTSPRHRNILDAMQFPNLRLCYRNTETGNTSVTSEFEKGDYDLITTRIDNDDAFQRGFVQSVQECYRRKAERDKPWAIILPYGYILDANSGQMFFMEHPANNCPTMVEDSQTPKTIWSIKHIQIPQTLPTEYTCEKPSWVMIVHGQNISNQMIYGGTIKVHYDKPLPLSLLADFNIHLQSVPKF